MNEYTEIIKAGKTIESAFNLKQDYALAAAMAFCGCASPDTPQKIGVTDETGVTAK